MRKIDTNDIEFYPTVDCVSPRIKIWYEEWYTENDSDKYDG